VGCADDRFVWEGEECGLGYRVTLWLHTESNAWFWRLELPTAFGAANLRR